MRAIVHLEGRPAILIEDGDFGAPPPEWARLTARRAQIREVIARSGRVEVSGHVELDWIGTASLVAPGTLMTNRHVAEEFCARRGERWTFRQGMTPRIDFLAERGSTASFEFEITETIGVHEKHDLALLAVESASSDGRALPEPLAVAASEPADLADRDVYVVGYRPGTAAATSPSRSGASSPTCTTSSGSSPGGPSATRPRTPPSSTTAPRSAGTPGRRWWTSRRTP